MIPPPHEVGSWGTPWLSKQRVPCTFVTHGGACQRNICKWRCQAKGHVSCSVHDMVPVCFSERHWHFALPPRMDSTENPGPCLPAHGVPSTPSQPGLGWCLLLPQTTPVPLWSPAPSGPVTLEILKSPISPAALSFLTPGLAQSEAPEGASSCSRREQATSQKSLPVKCTGPWTERL